MTGAANPKVLLVAKSAAAMVRLVEYLQRLGCECCVTTSCQDARLLLTANTYDLVLSETTLPDGSGYRLIPLLLGSRSSLYYAVPVHDSCWWLPALERGEHCLGASALRPNEFALK